MFSWAVYCGESCRLEARSIHHYECKMLPSFHAIYTCDSLLKAVRIILKVGAKELFRIFQTKDPEYLNPNEPFGTTPDCIYDSQSYLSVYHLVAHPEKKAFMERGKNVANALIAAEILDANTPFFVDIPTVRKKEFKNFVAATITRHWEAASVNSGVVKELLGLGKVSFESGFSGKIAPEVASDAIGSLNSRLIAGALYPVVSLINHSCDPNVSPLNHPANGKIVVMTHRALKKGEPVHLSFTTAGSHTGTLLFVKVTWTNITILSAIVSPVRGIGLLFWNFWIEKPFTVVQLAPKNFTNKTKDRLSLRTACLPVHAGDVAPVGKLTRKRNLSARCETIWDWSWSFLRSRRLFVSARPMTLF